MLAAVCVAVAAWLSTRSARGEHAPVAAAMDLPRISSGVITYGEGFEKRAGIVTTEVGKAKLLPEIYAVGTVTYDAEHVAAVGTRLRGLVSRVDKFEGDTVVAGGALARLESAELGAAQASVSTLQAEKQAALANAERERRLAERQLTTARESEIATVEAQRAELLLAAARQKVAALTGRLGAAGGGLGLHAITSPIAGTVVERNVAPGQFVDGELVAFKIANLDHVWLELDVFERSLTGIAVGDRAELRPLAGDVELGVGRVAKISSRIDPETHSAKVRIEVDNKNRKLRIGQAVQAKIFSTARVAGLRPVVPTSAITFVDGEPTVFVVVGPRAARIQKVKLGASSGKQTEVVSGLDGGERVVSSGVFPLKSELFR